MRVFIRLFVYLLFSFTQKFMVEQLPAQLKPDLKITRGKLMLQKAVLQAQYNTVTIPTPLQVKGLRSHHLGVDVANARSLAFWRGAVQHPSLQ